MLYKLHFGFNCKTIYYCRNLGRYNIDIICIFLYISNYVYSVHKKKEQITFLRSIVDWFLNFTYVMDIIIINFIITEIILQFGYMDGLTGAVLIIIGLPIYIVAIIYKIIYYRVNRNKKFINKEK